jgi:hypothetical protein
MHTQHFERGRDAEAAVEPAAVRNGIEMAADNYGLRRSARQRDPVVAGRISRDVEPERGDFAAKPVARVTPDRSPRETLRSVGGCRPGGELAQIGDYPLCIQGDDFR